MVPLWHCAKMPMMDVSQYVAGDSAVDPNKLNGSDDNRWQGCIEERDTTPSMSFDATNLPGDLDPASYGATSATDGTDASPANDGIVSTGGLGGAGAKVVAPPNSGLMFVEIDYDYMPVVGTDWLPSGATKLHCIASFIIRDGRNFSQIFNPAMANAAIQSTSDKFTG